MQALIALVGRSNVGKSTLFNTLTHRRDALVCASPGMTRDLRYGRGVAGDRTYTFVDTGGLGHLEDQSLQRWVEQQSLQAVRDAAVVLFIVDARSGLTVQDETLAASMRPLNDNLLVIINKSDGADFESVRSDCFKLGYGQPLVISALRRRGIKQMMQAVSERMPAPSNRALIDAAPRVAFIGRPNVGKSTLINNLIGAERVLASATPGTTRDSIDVDFSHRGVQYTLTDTAGMRRRSKIDNSPEKLSVSQTLQVIKGAGVVVLLVDAEMGIVEQDVRLLGLVLSIGCSLIVAVNKCDLLSDRARKVLEDDLQRRLVFASFVKVHYICAIKQRGIDGLMRSVQSVYQEARMKLSTPELTRMLQYAVHKNPPPIVDGRRVKPRYAHQGGSAPPTIVIHGRRVEKMPQHYCTYLKSFFIKALGIQGTPLRLVFQSSPDFLEFKRGVKKPAGPRSAQTI